MRRSFDFQTTPPIPQHGWSSTSSDYYDQTTPHHSWNSTSPDYYEHVTWLQRTPSIITNAPYYPSVPSTLHEGVISGEVPVDDEHDLQLNHHEHQGQEEQKKVHFPPEHQKTTKVHQKIATEAVKDGKGEVFVEKDINLEADGFIKLKHKNFDMLKWATFKGR